MSKEIINVTRGNVVECIHRGDIAVVNTQGKILKSLGNPNKYTYFRSAAKPIQALEVILSGAADKYGLNKSEIAITCASHYAEDFHLETVKSILRKINCSIENILCGPALSLKQSLAESQMRDNIQPQPILSDCSGKHAGMLAVCKALDFNLGDYLSKEHPLQQNLKKLVSEYCGYQTEKTEIGIDGCSVPVFALPISNMAYGFARLANPEKLTPELQKASKIIFDSMVEFPEMISGTDGFCTELIRHTNGRMIGKIGAKGVYCIGIKGQNIGIALKIEDGNMEVIPPAVMQILIELNLLQESEIKSLSKFIELDSVNDEKLVVGKIYPKKPFFA